MIYYDNLIRYLGLTFFNIFEWLHFCLKLFYIIINQGVLFFRCLKMYLFFNFRGKTVFEIKKKLLKIKLAS